MYIIHTISVTIHAHTFILGNLNPKAKTKVIHTVGENTYKYVFTRNMGNN